MGFWAGIKHALNSTLGTSDFKPLDEIYKDTVESLINSITVSASDNPLKILVSTQTDITRDGIIRTFNANSSGTVRIIADINAGNNVSFSVINQSGQQVGYKVAYDGATKLNMDINATKGVTYTIQIYGSYSYCYQLSVCGDTVFGRPIT